jgi:hypothetical protein
LLIRESPVFNTDQELSSGSLTHAGMMLEIVRGKIVRRIEHAGLQFDTRRFWKSLVALGGAGTVWHSGVHTHKGLPWIHSLQGATAPAGLFKDVDVISTAALV